MTDTEFGVGALRPLELDALTLGPTGMVIKRIPSFEEWAAAGELLRTFEHGLQWCIGAWLNFGEAQYGEKAAQVIDHKAWSESTVTVYRWVEKQVPLENRRMDLHFSHHQAVAALPPDQQRVWLEKAAAGSTDTPGSVWSVPRLKQELVAAAVADGKGVLRYLLVVECDDEQARERLAARLESDGLTCKRMEAARKRAAKAKAPTARKRRAGKANTKRRKS